MKIQNGDEIMPRNFPDHNRTRGSFFGQGYQSFSVTLDSFGPRTIQENENAGLRVSFKNRRRQRDLTHLSDRAHRGLDVKLSNYVPCGIGTTRSVASKIPLSSAPGSAAISDAASLYRV